MEFLRKTSLVILIAIFSISAKAQSDEIVIKAFKKSYTYEANGEYAKAIKILKKVHTKDAYEINLRLGWLTYSSGIFTESMAFYQKAIDKMSYSIEAKFGIVYPAAALGKWEMVENQYKEILKISPNNTTANYKLGLIYYGREKYDTAQKYFDKIINLFPFDYNSLLMLAWTKLKLEKMGEAKILFNKVLMYSPDDKSATEGLKLIK